VAVTKINPRMTPKPAPVRTIEVVLDGDYAGWWARMRTNQKFGTLIALTSDDTHEQLSAMRGIFVEWNWPDENGQPLPQPGAGGIEEADAEAVKAALSAWGVEQERAAALPKA
jgi:hypothetical protein